MGRLSLINNLFIAILISALGIIDNYFIDIPDFIIKILLILYIISLLFLLKNILTKVKS
jgi:hypothetical protein